MAGPIFTKRQALNYLQDDVATLQTQYAALLLRVAELERNNASGSPSSSPSSSPSTSASSSPSASESSSPSSSPSTS